MNIEKDLWTHLRETKKPIVMYGMGNGADKILRRFDEYGIKVDDFFASNGFVRGHSFHNKQVLSLTEIEQKYKDFIIVLSFASKLINVVDTFYNLNEKYEMYAPDVPVSGEGTFNLDFYNKNKDKFDRSRELLADDLSVKVFDNVIKYKLTGKINYLKEIETSHDEQWDTVLSPNKYEICVDAGAYNGDTALEMLEKCKNIKKIYALEPDIRNYKKLCNTFINESRVIPYNAASWNKETTLEFNAEGNRNSNTFSTNPKKTIAVNAATIDSICNNTADYIKYDVEGSEKNALQGSVNTIKNCSPDLLVSVYHRNEDLFEIPLLINDMNPKYKLFLRKSVYVPAWDLNLYAITPESAC